LVQHDLAIVLLTAASRLLLDANDGFTTPTPKNLHALMLQLCLLLLLPQHEAAALYGLVPLLQLLLRAAASGTAKSTLL
jgi:hypothetical protein